jgi:tRNA (cytidine/uridine-2'-O-)-methyltransferase
LRLALYEPDIPQNTGALLRLAACFGVGVDLIEPLGFLFDDRRLKRAALDYVVLAGVRRHASWAQFIAARSPESRLVLMTTSGTVALDRFRFAATDTRVVIRLQGAARSLNVAQAGAIALYEALRQTGRLPAE